MKIQLETIRSAQKERDGFANRLREALASAGFPDVKLPLISQHFNARSTKVVSRHAVRRWLIAEAIPRQHHVETLANWLGCEASWLRYGVERGKVRRPASSLGEDILLLQDLALLDAATKALVYELVAIMKKRGP